MGLFNKKKKGDAQQQNTQAKAEEQRQEVRIFGEQFSSEEITLLAVTGPAGLSYKKETGSDLWHISLPLTAWMDKYASEIELGEATLEALLDDQLLDYLLSRIPRNFVISVSARPDCTASRFLMTGLPTPTFDPDLKTIADEQKAPVTLDVDGLATFSLNRNLGWFEALVDWAGAEITLTFDQKEDARDAAIDTARALMSDPEGWDSRLCIFAADQLLERAQELTEEDEDPISREDFLAKLECDSILAAPDGVFEVWFGGEDLFMLRPVHVKGTLTDGPTLAEFEEQDP